MSPLSSPPIADPVDDPLEVASAVPAIQSYSKTQQLMFLESILQEYKLTISNWMASPQNVILMNDVLSKIGVAESAQVFPSFNEQESIWLQETLLNYEQTNWDWRRRLPDFNLMLYVQAQTEDGFATSTPPSPPAQGEATNEGMTPPPMDPYIIPS
jgi:hypothetical protein